MNIQFFEPLRRAWDRMVIALFKPFDIGKWFIVGFTAFLVDLTRGGGGGSKGGFQNKSNFGVTNFEDILDTPVDAWYWLIDHMQWFILIMIGAVLLIGLIIALTWLSARGSFMFLDNVVYNRAEIKRPWNQYKRQGNSLFLWKLGFGFACAAVIIGSIAIFGVRIYNIHQHGGLGGVAFTVILPFVLLLALLILIIVYVSMFLNNFVVPIMYKDEITVLPAWGKFLNLFSSRPFLFVLFGLLLFILHIAFGILVILVGLFTCCIGFLLLAIPYIGTVVTLPVSYTFRAFGVEFLEQFGPEFEIFPKQTSQESPDV